MELTMTLHEAAGEPTLAVIGLAGSVTIRDCGELKEALVGALAAADQVLLDLGGIAETDPSCIQLLCSARRTAEEAGRELSLAPKLSDTFIDAVLAAGFPSVGCFETGGSPLREE